MSRRFKAICGGVVFFLSGCGQDGSSEVEEVGSALEAASNWAGMAETVHSTGAIDRSNPFFQALGANLRTCETCHSSAQGWTMTAAANLRLFAQTQGLAPLFMVHDAGGSPTADISNIRARWEAFGSTTVLRGLIRFTRNISPLAEFKVQSVVDPYGVSTLTSVSSFRRPSPTANESKVAHTGWA